MIRGSNGGGRVPHLVVGLQNGRGLVGCVRDQSLSFGTLTCNLRQKVNARLDDAHMICVRLNDVKITNGVDRRHSHYTW